MLIRRGFLWRGRKEANGGCCLVGWEKVQMPLELGGLGIQNLEIMGWALQMKWLWWQKKLQQIEHGQVWKSLPIQMPEECLQSR